MSLLDAITGGLVGLTSFLCFGLFCLTAPKASRFPTLPGYVRAGVWLTSASLMVRSVALLTVSAKPDAARGHVDWAAMVASSLVLYTVAAGLYWLGSIQRQARLHAAEVSHA